LHTILHENTRYGQQRRKAKAGRFMKVQSCGRTNHSLIDIAAELDIRSLPSSSIPVYQLHLRFLAMAAPQFRAALLASLLALATLASCNTEGTTYMII
jgi:hypothetical protein